MITLEQYEQIRRMHYLEEKSGREIARLLGISRQTEASALQTERAPEYTLKKPREAPRLGPYQEQLDKLLEENGRLPKKQRYTGHKLFELLQAQGYAGSESSVQMYAVRWRKAHTRSATFLPLEFEPGQDGQVDWGEAQVILDGVRALGLRLRDASVLFTPHICHGFPGKQAGSLLLRACARL